MKKRVRDTQTLVSRSKDRSDAHKTTPVTVAGLLFRSESLKMKNDMKRGQRVRNEKEIY